MSLGENISKTRKKMHFTQEKLAEKLEVSRQTISDWERDVKKPELQNLIDLANILDVSIDWLLEDELKSTVTANKPACLATKWNATSYRLTCYF